VAQFTFNPITAQFDLIGMTVVESAAYLKLDQSTPQSVTGGTPSFGDIRLVLSGTIMRNASNYITSIAKTGGRTITPTRDGNGYISSITDGTKTWTFTRNASNLITGWSVA